MYENTVEVQKSVDVLTPLFSPPDSVMGLPILYSLIFYFLYYVWWFPAQSVFVRSKAAVKIGQKRGFAGPSFPVRSGTEW